MTTFQNTMATAAMTPIIYLAELQLGQAYGYSIAKQTNRVLVYYIYGDFDVENAFQNPNTFVETLLVLLTQQDLLTGNSVQA